MFRPHVRDKKYRWQLRNDARTPYEPWRWPLQAIDNRDPIVLAEHVNGLDDVNALVRDWTPDKAAR